MMYDKPSGAMHEVIRRALDELRVHGNAYGTINLVTTALRNSEDLPKLPSGRDYVSDGTLANAGPDGANVAAPSVNPTMGTYGTGTYFPTGVYSPLITSATQRGGKSEASFRRQGGARQGSPQTPQSGVGPQFVQGFIVSGSNAKDSGSSECASVASGGVGSAATHGTAAGLTSTSSTVTGGGGGRVATGRPVVVGDGGNVNINSNNSSSGGGGGIGTTGAAEAGTLDGRPAHHFNRTQVLRLLLIRADAFSVTRQHEKALQDALSAVEISNGTSPEAFFTLGREQRRLFHIAEAVEAFDAAEALLCAKLRASREDAMADYVQDPVSDEDFWAQRGIEPSDALRRRLVRGEFERQEQKEMLARTTGRRRGGETGTDQASALGDAAESAAGHDAATRGEGNGASTAAAPASQAATHVSTSHDTSLLLEQAEEMAAQQQQQHNHTATAGTDFAAATSHSNSGAACSAASPECDAVSPLAESESALDDLYRCGMSHAELAMWRRLARESRALLNMRSSHTVPIAVHHTTLALLHRSIGAVRGAVIVSIENATGCDLRLVGATATEAQYHNSFSFSECIPKGCCGLAILHPRSWRSFSGVVCYEVSPHLSCFFYFESPLISGLKFGVRFSEHESADLRQAFAALNGGGAVNGIAGAVEYRGRATGAESGSTNGGSSGAGPATAVVRASPSPAPSSSSSVVLQGHLYRDPSAQGTGGASTVLRNGFAAPPRATAVVLRGTAQATPADEKDEERSLLSVSSSASAAHRSAAAQRAIKVPPASMWLHTHFATMPAGRVVSVSGQLCGTQALCFSIAEAPPVRLRSVELLTALEYAGAGVLKRLSAVNQHYRGLVNNLPPPLFHSATRRAYPDYCVSGDRVLSPWTVRDQEAVTWRLVFSCRVLDHEEFAVIDTTEPQRPVLHFITDPQARVAGTVFYGDKRCPLLHIKESWLPFSKTLYFLTPLGRNVGSCTATGEGQFTLSLDTAGATKETAVLYTARKRLAPVAEANLTGASGSNATAATTAASAFARRGTHDLPMEDGVAGAALSSSSTTALSAAARATSRDRGHDLLAGRSPTNPRTMTTFPSSAERWARAGVLTASNSVNTDSFTSTRSSTRGGNVAGLAAASAERIGGVGQAGNNSVGSAALSSIVGGEGGPRRVEHYTIWRTKSVSGATLVNGETTHTNAGADIVAELSIVPPGFQSVVHNSLMGQMTLLAGADALLLSVMSFCMARWE